MNYILIIIATILLAFDFAFQKKYQQTEGANLTSGLKFNALNGLFIAVIFFIISGFKVEFSLFSAVLSFALAFLITAYTIIGFIVLKNGNMAIHSLFLMSGGMLLPYVFGVLFLNEHLSIFRIIGGIVILIAVIISNKSKYKFKTSLYLLCIAVFVLNGFVSIISKCHQINTTFSPVDTNSFVLYMGLSKFILGSLALIFCKRKDEKISFSSKNALLIIIASALVSGISSTLQFSSAKELPATVLYPLVTGGCIVFSALSGKVFYKEKISKIQWISIVLVCIGTLMFL